MLGLRAKGRSRLGDRPLANILFMDTEKIIWFLDKVDKQAMLALNFDGGSFLDMLFWTVSSKLIWVPIALYFIYELAFSRRSGLRKVILAVCGIALTVLLCDQISSSIIKPLVMRPRPSHCIGISEMLHYVNDYHGGAFGFVSSHSANAFGVAAYASCMLRKRWFSVFIFVFAAMVAYSRVYLGVHYLGDILGGCVLGLAVGYPVYYAVSALFRVEMAGMGGVLLRRSVAFVGVCRMFLTLAFEVFQRRF